MKPFFLLLCATIPVLAESSSDTIVLDAIAAKNLRIATVPATETTFEETAFTLGHIAEIPQNHAALSSRISGRVVELTAQEGDIIKKDQVLVRVESRQPGSPPPVIELRAPIDGMLVESHIRLGEPVEPDKELLDISNLSAVHAIAQIPEHLASQLKPGSQAYIRIPALGVEPQLSTLQRFGTSADRTNGTIDAIFQLDNRDLKLRPAMRAEFSLILNQRRNVLSIPREALQGDPSQRFVFVKDFEIPNAFIKCPVVVGAMNERAVEVISGIFPTDDIVTRGAYSLSFAGKGNVSLKEALDAAHGHEHAEDGSELTPEKRSKAAAGHDEDHHSHSAEDKSLIWQVISGVLAVLLIVSLVTKSRRGNKPQPVDETAC